MKLLIVTYEEKIELINQSMNTFKELGIDFNMLSIPKSWCNEKLFYSTIFNYSYFLIFINKEICKKDWFKFILAYCLGKKCSLFLLLTEKFKKMPVYLDFINYGYNIDSIKEYYILEKNLFIQKEIIENANEKIIKAGYYFTPYYFFLSIDRDDIEVVRLFLQAEMSPDTRNEKGVPALNFAVRLNHSGVFKVLLEHNCNYNEVSNDNGNNALMDAAGQKNVEIVKTLIEKGIDINIKSRNEQTALMLAVSRNAPEIVDILLKAGANTEIKDVLDMTAKRYAEILNYQEIIDIFNSYNIS